MEQLHAMAIHNNPVELAACVFWYVLPSLSRTLSLFGSVLRLQLGRAKTGAGQWAQKPSSTPPVPWETPRECLLSERIGQEKESGGRGGGKKGGERRKGWREESIGRITQTQWNIPNYVLAGQILPCGHIVMRERETSEGMRGPLSVWHSVSGRLVRLSLSSVLCILGRKSQYNCFLPIFPSVFTQGSAHNSVRLYFTPFTLLKVCET